MSVLNLELTPAARVRSCPMKALALALALLALPSCGGALAAALPIVEAVIIAVQDAEQMLDRIEDVAGSYCAQDNPHPACPRYEKAMRVARGSLNVPLRAAHGGQKLDQQKVDEAFAEFRTAYVELQGVMQELGLMGADGAMKAVPGVPQLDVKTPMAMTLQVEE